MNRTRKALLAVGVAVVILALAIADVGDRGEAAVSVAAGAEQAIAEDSQGAGTAEGLQSGEGADYDPLGELPYPWQF
jgi:hypothetical protein